jgi:transposase
MDTRKNARLTPHCRGLLVERVMKVQVAAQFGVSIRTVDKWLERYRR